MFYNRFNLLLGELLVEVNKSYSLVILIDLYLFRLIVGAKDDEDLLGAMLVTDAVFK